ncbi:MAG: acylneuraminate cytidylyltransferase family protein [Gallionella sp.]|nr:acylneuraminate cytidylyltransferase family protein [Gallionella sp.]
MPEKKTFLAIIPARGGSKRLPRKNVLDLGGKPLIAWSIEAACDCPYLDEVMVTTDDAEIANVARLHGANVPFLRPEALASDTAASFDAIKHAIDFYQHEMGREFDFVVLLQPTSPLRGARDISAAIELLEQKNADAIISVCEVDHSPLWMNTLPDDLSMDKFIRDEVKNVRSQDLPKNYRLNGAIYICRTSRLLAEESFFISGNIFAYIMNRNESVDIDDISDFRLAQSLLSKP